MTALPTTVNHYLHKNHVLKLVTTPPSGVICDGCKQFGKGSQHYRCEACNFDLHTQCATGPGTLKLQLFAGGEFTRYNVTGDPACGVCQGKVVGLGYSNELDIFVHPCCCFMPPRVIQDDRVFQLVKDPVVTCGICKDKSQSLSYRTSSDNGEHVCLHVPCLVLLNNNLTGNQDWTASAPIIQGVRGLLTTTTKNSGNGGGVMKKAKTVYSILNLAFSVATLDPVGIAESLQSLAGGFE